MALRPGAKPKLLNSSSADGLTSQVVEASVSRIERGIKKRYPQVSRFLLKSKASELE